MADHEALISFFETSLPQEVSSLLHERIHLLESGDFGRVLGSEEAQSLFNGVDPASGWGEEFQTPISSFLGAQGEPETKTQAASLFIIGYAALLAFLQANVTGPPLPFSSARMLFSEQTSGDKNRLDSVRAELVKGLSVDGVSAYSLTPSVELLVLAVKIFDNEDFISSIEILGTKAAVAARWARIRTTMMHQRLLSEASGALEQKIYEDLETVEAGLENEHEARVQLLLEKAAIETFHGQDKKAREDLDEVARLRGFKFALTGLLGKRTKFQGHDLSQLVVLAKSADEDGSVSGNGKEIQKDAAKPTGPQKLDLNDDTLLESISFTETPKQSTDMQEVNSLPRELTDLDPSNQPLLNPLDSIILLALASSITNTSPSDGLTREETVPYAIRVLEGGSSNWQVYTQALLVRSRCEGYKSRTVERGLLQLQALVDQVIADTTASDSTSNAANNNADAGATSFLPKGSEAENAPVSERLKYIFQIASPSRWELEAELAQRWVQLGGLKSALEIYERLQMWAEAALCYAAVEKEETAKRMIRKQLFHTTSGVADLEADDEETWEGEARTPPPGEAARFYCILGDIDGDPAMYDKAWEVSGERYARAKRSLGRYYLQKNDHVRAADAYAKSLKAHPLNHASWFALGCSLLELQSYEKAAESFRRCVQLDETDAEAWSNLAAAILKNEATALSREEQQAEEAQGPAFRSADDDEEEDVATTSSTPKFNPQQNRLDALRALKRAATLKNNSHRIWENLLVIAASVTPPDYAAIISAQKHLIDLRGPTIGEKAVDVEIMGLMTSHIISTNDSFDPQKPGFERFFVDLVDKSIIPLITGSAPLWLLVAKLALWRRRPDKALDAQEKAWRAVVVQPGWETESEKRWDVVVDATVELCDAYESLGPMERTDGMGAGSLVAKDWKFKARSAVRGILGRGRDSWEGTSGWHRLQDVLAQMKG